jgi:hypothetical protein
MILVHRLDPKSGKARPGDAHRWFQRVISPMSNHLIPAGFLSMLGSGLILRLPKVRVTTGAVSVGMTCDTVVNRVECPDWAGAPWRKQLGGIAVGPSWIAVETCLE